MSYINDIFTEILDGQRLIVSYGATGCVVELDKTCEYMVAVHLSIYLNDVLFTEVQLIHSSWDMLTNIIAHAVHYEIVQSPVSK